MPKAKLDRNTAKMFEFAQILSRLYLCVLLIVQSADTETNPGPKTPKYPCQVCEKAVRWNQKGVACDHCSAWSHKVCIGMTTQEYDRLTDNENLTWYCNKCDRPNHSTSLFASALADESTNTYSTMSESVSRANSDSYSSIEMPSFDESTIGQPMATSSPSQPVADTGVTITIKDPHLKRKTGSKDNIKILVVNCQSLKNKKEQLTTIIQSADPDILMITETWLHPNIKKKEIFPDYYATGLVIPTGEFWLLLRNPLTAKT